MSLWRALEHRPRRCLLGAVVLVAGALWLLLPAALPGPVATLAAGQSSGGEPVPQTEASLPARDVTMIGAAPEESPGETWGLGLYDNAAVLLRYTEQSGWSPLTPGLLDTEGQPLSGFRLAQPEAFRYFTPSPLAGQMTPKGDGVMVGAVPGTSSHGQQQVVLVREPGEEAFKETPAPAGLLQPGESLFGLNQAPMVAALEEAGTPAHAGALVVPVAAAGTTDTGVLHWNGASWSREPIEVPAKSSTQFEVLAIGASSPQNAWLIARLSSEYPTGAVALFRRHLSGSGPPTWQPVTPKPGGEAGEPLAAPTAGGAGQSLFTVPSSDQSQILTVTGEGVWIDGVRADVHASTTMFFKPEGEAAGRVLAAWCKIPAGSPEGTPRCAAAGSSVPRELPEALPTGPSRSFAWADPSTPEGLGERIVTGLPDGVSLRLEGAAFGLVPALGGNAGASFGAAFSSPSEGWLGKELLPIHLTREPTPSRLSPWPVSFHHALVALAPQPGAPVGALTSEALAVGDEGEVSRYKPGQGWLPESLLGPGGRRETPRLRAVAWPRPSRAFAVGDLGQMWLWRGETGLWEPDPATPPNFRGNLLGIAFDPSDTARGYAVGEGGVLLRYGKTWTQEPTCAAGVPQPCLPPEVAGANFTAIAFAGSEAIVAYRKLPNPALEVYEGGLLVNEGSGWQIDRGAAQAMGANVPWAVAGLPDGGAAFTASGHGESAQVYERESSGAPWQATPAHLPVGASPGSLALFREGAALRAVVAGSQPDTYEVESEPNPPPGFPPKLVPPYPLPSDTERGVLRQTATGWSDEEHELNEAKEPPGVYAHYDTPYQPDPVAAVLVDPTGTQGWAVGGVVDDETSASARLDTADVWRYPADGSAPVGVGAAAVAVEPKGAVFAIGGNAQCAAPCAERANTRIGPDVWLSHALSVAGNPLQIAGVRAFLYTGPRVTSGETAGPATLTIPYRRELERYAALLHSSPVPAYAAASPTDLDGAGSERTFEEVFGGLPAPFGQPVCETAGCQSAYYELPETVSGGVRVIVLDDASQVIPKQREWLEERLEKAKPHPAIVLGSADLSAQLAAGSASAAKLVQVLVCGKLANPCKKAEGGASAYFFDAPEKNVELPLRAGVASITSFGSGTLGYVNKVAEEQGDFIGASGFLLAQVDIAERSSEELARNQAKVHVELIPNIGELAMEAVNGTLLRRSQAAVFDGLARRPLAGNVAHNQSVTDETSPYIPIPSLCVGTECANGLFPEYSFSSSNPQIGGFVKPNLTAEPKGREPLTTAAGEPEREPINPATGREESKSGLFCAYNPGTTIVTLSAGGLAYSLPVTVQAGSVREPCGTVPANKPHLSGQSTEAPAPPPAPSPAGPAPASAPPVVPVPPPPPTAPVAAPPARPSPPRPVPPAPFLLPAAPAFLPVAFVPPPLPAPAEPTPPSGTSAVTSPVEAAQKEEEEEEATESVSNQALAYRAPEHEPSPVYILGIVALAAFAGASTRRRARGGRGDLRVAPATLSAMRAQRRMAPRRGRRG